MTFPTQIKGHPLGLVLTDNECTIIAEVLQGDLISEHYLIDCKLNIAKSQNSTQWRYCCKKKEKFQEGLASIDWPRTIS